MQLGITNGNCADLPNKVWNFAQKSSNLLAMRYALGHGGWIGVDDVGLPGPLYVRVRDTGDGRLRVSEVYLDANESENGITRRDLDIPMSQIETVANTEANAEFIRKSLQWPAPDLSTAATYFQTEFPTAPENPNWLVRSFLSQIPAADRAEAFRGEPRVSRRKRAWVVVADDREFKLNGGPNGGRLTDEFLADVARAYAAAAHRGERPNMSIAEQTGYPANTVRRWVYLARQRKIMKPGRQGSIG